MIVNETIIGKKHDDNDDDDEVKFSIWERNKFLALVNNWSSNARCFDGIPNIGKAENVYWKLIWTIAFFGMTGYCTYSLSLNIIDYFQYDVTTQISMQRSPSIEFPTVTFCNKNPFKLTSELASVLNDTRAKTDAWIAQGYDSLSVMTGASYNVRLAPYYLNKSLGSFYNFSYDLDDMLISCLYQNERCDNQFFRIFTTNYGNCYQFNSGKLSNGSKTSIYKTSIAGRHNALKLELFVGYESDETVIKSSGIQLFVHNSSYLPLFGNEGMSLAIGYEYDVVIKQIFYNKLPTPYSDCLPVDQSFDSDLYRETVKIVSSYNQKYCLQLCSQAYLLKMCGCWDLLMPQPDTNKSGCSIELKETCVVRQYESFYGSDEVSKCFTPCPLECNSIGFGAQLSRSDFPSPSYSQIMLQYAAKNPNSLRNFTTYSQLKSSTLAINVFYDDIAYSEVKEYPARSVEQLVADIGGIAGLCIGASFLSIIELFELVYRLIYLKLKGNEPTRKDEQHVEETPRTMTKISDRSIRSGTSLIGANRNGALKRSSFARTNKVRQMDEGDLVVADI